MQLLIFVFTIFCCYYSTSNTYCCISCANYPAQRNTNYKIVEVTLATVLSRTALECKECNSSWLNYFWHLRCIHNRKLPQSSKRVTRRLLLIPCFVVTCLCAFLSSVDECVSYCLHWYCCLHLYAVPSKCQEVLDCSGTSLIKPVNLRCRYIMSHPTNYHILQFSHLTYYSSCYLLSMTCILRHFGEMMTLSVTHTYFIYKICAGSVW